MAELEHVARFIDPRPATGPTWYSEPWPPGAAEKHRAAGCAVCSPPAGTPARFRDLPPTRSDTACGKNRYGSADAAFSALWAHAQAKGYPAATMIVVSHDLCPGFFHIVPRSKASAYVEVRHG